MCDLCVIYGRGVFNFDGLIATQALSPNFPIPTGRQPQMGSQHQDLCTLTARANRKAVAYDNLKVGFVQPYE